MANNINIRKSAFLATNEKGAKNEKAVKTETKAKVKAKKSKASAATENSIANQAVEPQVKTVDFTSFEVHLDNEMTVSIDLSKKTKYRLKNGCLYYGLFKKIGKVKFIRAKF